MKDVLVRAGSSLLAAAVGYILLTVFAANLSTTLKLLVAAIVGLCAFGVAVWAARGETKEKVGSVALASDLKGASAHIEDVRAAVPAGQRVKVASDIDVQGPIEIKRAEVSAAQEKK